MGISCNQLRFRRWPSCDPSGYCEIATSAYGLLAMTNLRALCGRRCQPITYQPVWRSLTAATDAIGFYVFRNQPVFPPTIFALSTAGTSRQYSAGSGTPLPYSARLFVNFTKLFPIHFSVFMIHLIIISTPDTVPRGARPAAAAGTRLPG